MKEDGPFKMTGKLPPVLVIHLTSVGITGALGTVTHWTLNAPQAHTCYAFSKQ